MVLFASIIAGLALAGAIASWGVGAWCCARTLLALSDERWRSPAAWLAVASAAISWPFARRRLEGTAPEQAGRLNKALVALFACLTVAAAATSVATNLARVR